MSEGPPTTNLQQLINEEASRTQDARHRYGVYVDTAQSAIALLNTFIVSVSRQHVLAAAMMSSAQKSATLGFLSYIRAHSAQAEFNARQLIESCTLAAYLLAHPDEDVTRASGQSDKFRKPNTLSQKAYRCLDREDSKVSSCLKEIKYQINESTSHARVLLTNHTLDWQSAFPTSEMFNTYFFGHYGGHVVQLYLMSHARLVLLVIETIRQVVKKYGGFVLIDDVDQRLARLGRDVNAHREQLALRFPGGGQ